MLFFMIFKKGTELKGTDKVCHKYNITLESLNIDDQKIETNIKSLHQTNELTILTNKTFYIIDKCTGKILAQIPLK